MLGGRRVVAFHASARLRIHDASMLVLVAIDAEQLPVRTVRRVVVVIAVLVMHRQLAQPLPRKLARAPRADVRQDLECVAAVIHYPLLRSPAATPLMVRWIARS